ncbi:LamG domain-containing protein [Leifsonia shinshuensis]|uniref:LamG domain-containing protein n=1 Tax=Leifsonia shinshuensis TaxID=150026 RepID=UPI001F509757|nr:LamG domain-containing protein [Leifsonia shinshuensis]MCI0157203.1 LamG domain-containing protein [Leifsonia shinshuensis]
MHALSPRRPPGVILAVAGLLSLVAPTVADAAQATVAAETSTAVPVGATAPRDSENAAGEREAREIAAAYGHDVIVDSQTSATWLVKARPDGYLEAVGSQAPEQAEVNGRWRPVDTSLVKRDGRYEAAVAAVPVRIGAGGSNEIVSIRTESGEWVTETWPHGELPAPVVRHDSATFREVLPGVDLRVAATKSGMREVLVIKDEHAAKDDRLASLRLAVHGAQLVEDPESDTLEARPQEGAPLVASIPVWWDSSHPGADAESPGGAEAQPLDRSVSGHEAVLDIGAVVDSGVTYPLYVDPDFGAGLLVYWYTDRAYPNTRYVNQPETKVGRGVENGITYLSRSYHRFVTERLAGVLVQSAQFSITQTWANSCDANPVQLWQAGEGGNDYSWNSDPNLRGRLLDQRVSRKGSSCEAPGAVGFDATAVVQEAAAVGNRTVLLALGSAAGDAGNQYTRKHYTGQSRLTVTYNTRPDVPTGARMIAPDRGCSTDRANPSYVNGSQPLTLQVNATDRDPENVSANFFLREQATATGPAGPERLLAVTPLQAQGANLRTTIAADSLADGRLYAWYAEASDWKHVSASRTAPCYFVVDSSKPALPTIALVSAATSDGQGGFRVRSRVGEAVTIRVTPPADEHIAGYQAWWTTGTAPSTSPVPPVTDYTSALPACRDHTGAARIICADPGGVVEFQAAPPDTLATLWVAAYDRAGNVSFALATGSGAAGLTVRAGAPDLSAGHAWMPWAPSGTRVDDAIGGVPLTVGTFSGWREDSDEDPQLAFPALETLTRFVAPNWIHRVEVDPARVPTNNRIEQTFGQIARAVPGRDQPPNTHPLYSCAWGAANMLSKSATCEGTNVAARLLGYAWKTAADVPGGMAGTEIFRCRVGNDYFVSTQRACEGQTFEGSHGFVGAYRPTVTDAPVVDLGASYSVSARVQPATASGTQTVLAGDAQTESPFSLGMADGRWRFCVRFEGAAVVPHCATGPAVVAGRYATATGTWDVVNHRVSIAVWNGLTLGSEHIYIDPSGASTSSVALVVGSSRQSRAVAHNFGGSVADVSVYPSVLPEQSLTSVPIPLP